MKSTKKKNAEKLKPMQKSSAGWKKREGEERSKVIWVGETRFKCVRLHRVINVRTASAQAAMSWLANMTSDPY